jgi:hypothetical protein
MKRFSTTATALPPTMGRAWKKCRRASIAFALAAGLEALGTMIEMAYLAEDRRADLYPA